MQESLLCDLPAEIIYKVWVILTGSKDGDRHYDSRVKERDKEKARRDEFMRYLPGNIERFPDLNLTPSYQEIPLHHDTALRSCSKHFQSVCDTARTSIFLREGMQASAEAHVRKLTSLKAVSMEYTPKSDVCSSLTSLHSIQPALTSLILHANVHRTLGVDLLSVQPAWSCTLQRLELHQMECMPTSQLGQSGLGFLTHLSSLKELRLHHVSPHLKTEDIVGCSSLQKLTLQSGHLHFDTSQKASTVLDLSSLSHLQELSCDLYSITQLNMSGLRELWRLVCTRNRRKHLDVSSCTSLRHLSCGDNELSELDLSHNTDICLLDCITNPLSKLSVSACTSLADLKCGGPSCSITTLDLSVFSHMHTLECAGMEVCTLDVQAISNIESVSIYGCEKLLVLNLSGLKRLRQVSLHTPRTSYFKTSAVASLDISGCTSLEAVDCAYSYALTTVCASGCVALHRLDLRDCGVTSIDLSRCLRLAGPFSRNCFPTPGSLDLTLCVGLWDVTHRCTGKVLNVLPSAATLLTIRCKHCEGEVLDAYGYSNHREFIKIFCWGGQELRELLCLGCGKMEKLRCPKATKFQGL